MKWWGKILQALLGVMAAAAVAIAIGSWAFPAEGDRIAAFSGLQLTKTGLGAGLSLLTWLAFTNGWMSGQRRRDRAMANLQEKKIAAGMMTQPENLPRGGAGRFLNGLGFGLMPATAVWKAFEARTMLGRGEAIPEGISRMPWITAEGYARPGQIETGLAVLLFATIILWLMLRKRELPENGDLLGVAVSLWAAARLVTEPFRAEQIPLLGEHRVVGWMAAGVLAVTLIRWTIRILRAQKNTGYAWACLPVFGASIAGIVLIQNEKMLTGNPLVDLIMQVCLALLALKAVLCAGRVSRD